MKDSVFTVATKKHADMLHELLSKAAASGPDARVLADLFEEATRVKAEFEQG